VSAGRRCRQQRVLCWLRAPSTKLCPGVVLWRRCLRLLVRLPGRACECHRRAQYALPLQLFVVQLLWWSVGGLHGRLTLQSPLHLRRPIRDMNHACSALSHWLPGCASCVACVPQDAGGALWCAVSWAPMVLTGSLLCLQLLPTWGQQRYRCTSQGAEAAVPFRQRGGIIAAS
jgi:hypothetical protein